MTVKQFRALPVEKQTEIMGCIPDPFARLVLFEAFIKRGPVRRSWLSVATCLGGRNTADSVRMIATRTLKELGPISGLENWVYRDLVQLMQDRNMNRLQAAALVGLLPRELNRSLKGERSFTPQEMVTLGAALGLAPADYYGVFLAPWGGGEA